MIYLTPSERKRAYAIAKLALMDPFEFADFIERCGGHREGAHRASAVFIVRLVEEE
ncbi:MAG: hypothetical protein ACRBBQ_09080 [Cognatishimia sp.]